MCGGIILEEALDLSFDRLLMMVMMMIQKCASFHMHDAESTRKDLGTQVIAELWVPSMNPASYHPSGT